MGDFWQDDLLATEVADAVALALSVDDTTNEMLLGCIIDGIYKAGWGLVCLADDTVEAEHLDSSCEVEFCVEQRPHHHRDDPDWGEHLVFTDEPRNGSDRNSFRSVETPGDNGSNATGEVDR